MLQTEDMDDDYFTPASSTSLANIFGKSRKEDTSENESLKYTPPKPAKPEEPKATQCVFACAVLGYEWSNGAYVAKGKLGFAILKIIKTGFHNIVLYDSNKTTLSCATISSTFVVTVKENLYFSYVDNLQKYWSLNATEHETKKVVELLKSFDVIIKYSSDEDKGPPDVDTIDTASAISEPHVKEEKESDTDSSINRRTKVSILNRMANMGQSVLPPRTVFADKTSDSSDTNDTNHYKTVRHKPVKSSMKRNSSDRNLPECQSLVEPEKIGSSVIESNGVPLFSYVNGQLLPVTNTNIVSSPSSTSGNDMNFFISEQRISNSEIRININRMTDKVDQILGKISDLEHKDRANADSFRTEILQKLLSEYETKIKMYEGLIKSQDLDKHFIPQKTSRSSKDDSDDDSEKILELEKLSKEKDDKIAALEAKVKVLQQRFDEVIVKEKKSKEELHVEIEQLRQVLDTKSKEVIENSDETSKDVDESIGNKIKNVMNDTFRTLATNFENNKQYTGERVKAVTAAVIKKVTIESLNNLK